MGQSRWDVHSGVGRCGGRTLSTSAEPTKAVAPSTFRPNYRGDSMGSKVCSSGRKFDEFFVWKGDA